MIKIILFFVLFWACVAGAYSSFRALSGKDKLTVLKLAFQSAAAAAVATVILSTLVYLF